MKNFSKTLKNEKGILTLDFLFATMLVFAFSAILFSFAFTFSVVEVVQYISYSAARNYSLAHQNESKQRERGEQKFAQLSASPALASLVSAGWFSIGQAQFGDFNDEFPSSADLESANFVGARVPFSAPIMYKRIPLLGTTASDPEGFTANLSSYLSRHPTFQECQDFAEQRAQGVSALGYSADQATVIMDNGC